MISYDMYHSFCPTKIDTSRMGKTLLLLNYSVLYMEVPMYTARYSNYGHNP